MCSRFPASWFQSRPWNCRPPPPRGSPTEVDLCKENVSVCVFVCASRNARCQILAYVFNARPLAKHRLFLSWTLVDASSSLCVPVCVRVCVSVRVLKGTGPLPDSVYVFNPGRLSTRHLFGRQSLRCLHMTGSQRNTMTATLK